MTQRTILSLIFILASTANAQWSGGGGDSDRYTGSHVSLFGAWGQQDYSVGGGGSGTSINLKNSIYTQYGLAAKWMRAESNWGLGVSWDSHNVNLSAPASLFTPTSVHVNQQTAKYLLYYRLQRESGQPIDVGLGYWYAKRGSTDTSPNELVTGQTKGGPLLAINYMGAIDDTFNIGVRANLGMVNFFHESKAITGAYRSGYTLDAKVLVIYPTSRFVDLSLGVQLYYDSTNFDSTGTRNFTSAHETTIGYGIPFELTVLF